MKKACLTLLLGIGMVSGAYGANANGPGALGGDLWQGFLQILLNIPPVSERINVVANEAPFYIPQAKSHGLTTFRNRSISLTLQAKHRLEPDEVELPLQFEIVSPPLHGTLEGAPPNLVYTPAPDYTGFDELVFAVSDGVHGSSEGTIQIKVQGSYTLFESGQVRPLALNSDSSRLYALNTPDARLEIFDINGHQPVHLHSVPVGLEPVALALRNDQEAWVVNTLSDSISIVDLAAPVPHVKRTLQVGDEPQDIVFAGPARSRAFVGTAHRGQNSPSELEPLTPGLERADVWVFDGANPTQPLNIVTLFGMPPRGLAVSPDGATVYAGIYKSGNQSTIAVHNYRLFGKLSTAYGKPGPKDDASGVRAPNTGVIVRYDGNRWRDYYGTNWSRFIHFDLPDYDVFEIDAMADTPAVAAQHAHVGNALFNLAVNPQTGALYVSNLEARNELKFEGQGERSDVQTLRGRFIQNRITVIKNGEVLPRDLNPHLTDADPDGSPDQNARSLALPLQMQVNQSGERLYVAAFGSAKVGVFDITELEENTFTPNPRSHIELSGGGPSGLVLDEANQRLFVLTRFDNGISVIDTRSQTEKAHVTMYNPEPDFIVEGRPFLYDARYSSGRGDSACGSCHLFGDMDGIAWNLGNPDASWTYNTRDYVNFFSRMNALRIHHPMKGPMLTQSLRGMEFQGPQHWRGDRTGAYRVNGESLERAAFKEFRGAFPDLLGRPEIPPEEDMNAFAVFVLQLRYPPSPIRNLDDTLTPEQSVGRDTFFNVKTTGFPAPKGGDVAMIPCNDCHEVDADIERFGTSTLMSFEGTETSQDMKVAHLRNVYTRVGMFGQRFRYDTPTNRFMGDQVTGYGFSHDGAADTLKTFLSLNVFHVPDERLDQTIDFVMAMPTGLAPMVGQQLTLDSAATVLDQQRLDLMRDQALQHLQRDGFYKPQCELIAQGVIAGEQSGWWLQEDGLFYPDRVGAALSDTALRALAGAPGNRLTFSCVPPGSGNRMALDRDEDAVLDRHDGLLLGRAPTAVQAANPAAELEQDVVVEPEEGGYSREESQKRRGVFPSFKDFWAF